MRIRILFSDLSRLLYGKPKLHFIFNIASASDMKKLGRAFAQAAPYMQTHSHQTGRAYRIGLNGGCNSGKTTFVSGFLKTFSGKIAIENASSSRRPQHLWYCGDQGYIRHYDAGLGGFGGITLPSYRHQGMALYDLPQLDIVEHPYHDSYNRRYDCDIIISRDQWLRHIFFIGNNKPSPRTVTIKVDRRLAMSEGFQAFLKASAPYMPPLERERTMQNKPPPAPTQPR